GRQWTGNLRDLPAPTVRLVALADPGHVDLHAPPGLAVPSAAGAPIHLRADLVHLLVDQYGIALPDASASAHPGPSPFRGGAGAVRVSLAADPPGRIWNLVVDPALAQPGGAAPVLARCGPARSSLANCALGVYQRGAAGQAPLHDYAQEKPGRPATL